MDDSFLTPLLLTKLGTTFLSTVVRPMFVLISRDIEAVLVAFLYNYYNIVTESYTCKNELNLLF